MKDLIVAQVNSALFECATGAFIASFRKQAFDVVVEKFMMDFLAFLNKDPSCQHNPNLLVHYTSLRAVLHYRIANQIFLENMDTEIAFSVSSRGKLLSQAEIHPFASIGQGFVLDHGVGTVIGETTVIGTNCYVLGGVVLGASGISGNGSNKRHPTLGNHVEVGTRAKVLGPIYIGNHVFIGADCLVTEDIEDYSRVVLKNTVQVTKAAQLRAEKVNA